LCRGRQAWLSAQIEAEKKRHAEAKKKEFAELGYEGEELANVMTNFLESLFGVDETELLARIKDPGAATVKTPPTALQTLAQSKRPPREPRRPFSDQS